MDLETQTIDVPGLGSFSFEAPPWVRRRLLHGLDDLDELLEHRDVAAAFRRADRDRRPALRCRSNGAAARRRAGRGLMAMGQNVPALVRHAGIAAPFRDRMSSSRRSSPLAPHAHARARPPSGGAPSTRSPEHTRRTRASGAPLLRRTALPSQTEPKTPTSVLNQARYRNASILIAGEHFGMGSLQAFAVMRLVGCGILRHRSQFRTVFFEDRFAVRAPAGDAQSRGDRGDSFVRSQQIPASR